jgi:hypothetical protein
MMQDETTPPMVASVVAGCSQLTSRGPGARCPRRRDKPALVARGRAEPGSRSGKDLLGAGAKIMVDVVGVLVGQSIGARNRRRIMQGVPRLEELTL